MNYSSPEGMKQQEAFDKQMQEQMKKGNPDWGPLPDVGFAKAKGDIDWVDSSKKFNA